MAIKSTVIKLTLDVADMDRNHYGSYPLTLAQHPSETEQRVLIRVLAFALNAEERLEFGKGLSVDDEPDLWLKALNGDIRSWIDLGQIDERRLRRASGRAQMVLVYTFQAHKAALWWQQNKAAFAKLPKLKVMNISYDESAAVGLIHRNAALHCTVQDQTIWLSDGDRSVEFKLEEYRH